MVPQQREEIMSQELFISRKATAALVYGRPPLVFAGMLCAVGVMWNRNPALYTIGVFLLFISMCFDLVDGWFSSRFQQNPTLAQLADRIMDKIVYSIIFPLVAVGMMWRLIFIVPGYSRIELLHAIFVMVICVAVLIRDNFAGFLRGFGIRQGQEPEPSEFTRLRTIVAAPVGAILYAHAFYIPEMPKGAYSQLYKWIAWLGHLPVRGLFVIEIIFFIITFGSIAAYCRKYGTHCLDEVCLDDDLLRRRILSVFPNALTVMNAMMGLIAVFFTYQGRIREAYLLLIGAAIFDRLDGAVARKLGLTEPLPGDENGKKRINFGSIMDDIADGVSFCIVPAWMFYVTFSEVQNSEIQHLAIFPAAMFYVAAGFARLTYFTLDKTPIPGFFKGMPTPAAALMVTAPLIMFSQSLYEAPEMIRFWGIFCVSLMVAASLLMNIYPIHYLHLGRFMGRKPWFARFTLILLAVVVFTPYLGHVALAYGFCYLLSPIITWKIDPAVAVREAK